MAALHVQINPVQSHNTTQLHLFSNSVHLFLGYTLF